MTLPRYLHPTHIALDAITARAKALDNVLEDIHTLAYDKHVGDDVTRGGTRQEWYLDEQGQQRAKSALADLERSVLKISKELEVQYAQIYSLLSGPGANDKLRGTTLGNDKGHGAQTELNKLQQKQRQRKERGEYTPHATEEQPEIPTR